MKPGMEDGTEGSLHQVVQAVECVCWVLGLLL